MHHLGFWLPCLQALGLTSQKLLQSPSADFQFRMAEHGDYSGFLFDSKGAKVYHAIATTRIDLCSLVSGPEARNFGFL
jgi:hypothetical protein